MVDWKSEAEIAKDAGTFSSLAILFMFRWVDRQRFTAVLSQLTYAMMGMVIWDLACTWDFELSLIRRKRTFRWPLVRCVYSMLCVWWLIKL